MNNAFVDCPNCQAKTIPYWLASNRPQVCSECGKSFIVKRSQLIDVLVYLYVLLSLGFGYYFYSKEKLPNIISLGIMVSGIVFNVFYQTKKRPLIESIKY